MRIIKVKKTQAVDKKMVKKGDIVSPAVAEFQQAHVLLQTAEQQLRKSQIAFMNAIKTATKDGDESTVKDSQFWLKRVNGGLNILKS